MHDWLFFFFSKEAFCDMTFFSVWLIGNGYFTRSGHALIPKPLSDEPVQNITVIFQVATLVSLTIALMYRQEEVLTAQFKTSICHN